MTDQIARNLNQGGAQPPQISPPGDAVPKTIPEIIQNFRATFKLMSKDLRYGGVEDDTGDTRKLGDSDIKGYIRDIRKFSDYVEEWETEEADLPGDIKSMQGLQQFLEEIVTQLNTTLSVDDRLKPLNLDMVQFDKGTSAYFTRLRECGQLISKMLRDCFV